VGRERTSVESELNSIRRTLAWQDELRAREQRLGAQVERDRSQLEFLQSQLSAAQEHVGSLVEGLASLRSEALDNVCPVCDRNYSEVSSIDLVTHIDRKISELTDQGRQLIEIREQRSASAAQLLRDEQELEQLLGELLPPAQREELESRRSALEDLRQSLGELEPVMEAGEVLRDRGQAARIAVENLEAAASDAAFVSSELERFAEALDVPQPREPDSLLDSWRQLSEVAAARLTQLDALVRVQQEASEHLARFQQWMEQAATAMESVADAAQRKSRWDLRIQEARRRQGVAKDVHQASATARAAVVQRVFTQSLNQVWRSVFTRLAPREEFIPAFGIPTSSKTALELTLQTTHVSGEAGGSPQMMLSGGNLNTAALSLFLALHLAVEPTVPCLVFDDPVQAMDEVHVAQFAGLIRILAKHHERQVVIAVHERELFDYLALELSPAFEGDELITIELGVRSQDEDQRVTRQAWAPDPAIAV